MYERALESMRGTRERLLQGWGRAEALHFKEANNAASAVTELDIEVEATVSGKLKSIFPDIAFVGEESGGVRDGKFWLMDPIDGTAHYIRGTALCTSMLALVEDGRVVFGAIYDFVNDRMYHAELGNGAFCNNDLLSVSDRSLRESYVGLETHLGDAEDLEYFKRLEKKTTIIHTITAGWELAMVAAGKLDGRICYHPYGKDYDFAPGTLLVSEAGGIVTNIGTRTFDYRNVNLIAVNKRIYAELTEGSDALFSVTS